MKFPFIGSAVLFSLFLVFKLLPKELVNLVLTAYFVVLGVLAITASALPFVSAICSPSLRKKEWALPKIKIPFLLDVSSGSLDPMPWLECMQAWMLAS